MLAGSHAICKIGYQLFNLYKFVGKFLQSMCQLSQDFVKSDFSGIVFHCYLLLESPKTYGVNYEKKDDQNGPADT